MNVTEVRFKGVCFPGVLHAQWALFFEDLFIPWQFRVASFTVEGQDFRPDFWLPRQELWFQVGDDRYHEEELRQWEVFARAAERTCCAPSAPCRGCDELGVEQPSVSLPEEWQVRDALYSSGGIPVPDEMTQSGPQLDMLGSMHTGQDNWYQWTVCPTCEFVGAEHEGRADRLSCGHGDPCRDDNSRSNHPRLLSAYRLARQVIAARFGGLCAECAQPMSPSDLVGAGRPVGRRRWYHADCLLVSRRQRYRRHQLETPVERIADATEDRLAG